ncbi:MAG: esterase-like activity of phytase family protein [Microcoleaceae cyanobacterium]
MIRKFSGFLMVGLGLVVAIAFLHQTLIVQADSKKLEFLGQATFPTGSLFEQTEIGGLSGITYNPDLDVYYVISDDRGEKTPPRFYTLKIDVKSGLQPKVNPDAEPSASKGSFDETLVNIQTATFLRDRQGQLLPAYTADPEGIAFAGESVFISSEGDVVRNIPPFIKEFSLAGQELQDLPIPTKFLTSADDKNFGTRNNLALESLTLTPSKTSLFTATEGALIQDGEPATPKQGSPSRIIHYDLNTGKPDREYIYQSEPIAVLSDLDQEFKVSGLVELLALDETRFLSLERSFSISAGNVIQLFKVSLDDADQVQGIDRLQDQITQFSPVHKTPWLNLNSLGLTLDNVEGMTFGPELPDGRRSLILVSDNNFNPIQVTQILLFAVPPEDLMF